MIDRDTIRQVIRFAGKKGLAEILDQLSDEECLALLYDWHLWRRPLTRNDDGTFGGQVRPDVEHDTWFVMAGRGFGKTRTGAETIREEVREGRASHVAFIGQDPQDVREVMIDGPSGIMAVSPVDERPIYNPSKKLLSWPNGARGHVYSANDPESLRGPEHDLGWGDEPASWVYPDETWSNFQLGLRRRGPRGDRPWSLLTGTPKPTSLVKEVLADPTTVVTTGSTFDNAANLAESFIERVVRKYEGTTLGEQELYAKLLLENSAALWTRDTLARTRVERVEVPDLKTIVVAVDPMASDKAAKRRLAPSETGIVVVGLGEDGDGYVLADYSVGGKPDLWARRVLQAVEAFGADYVVAEVNQGGDMVEDTLRMRDDGVVVKMVRASKGKRTRAEPVSTLYEQGRVHHVGHFGDLEDQLTQWGGADGEPSPDRLDALVWGVTDLMVRPEPTTRWWVG